MANKKKYNFSAEDVSSLKAIGEIPGVSDILKDSPELAKQVFEDPAGSLEAYNKALADGGADGSDPTAVVTVQDPITSVPYRDPAEAGLPNLSSQAGASMSSTDASLKQMEDAIAKMEKVNDQRLSGQIPDDVVQAVRMSSAEAAMSQGLGVDSQAARNLTARDLGVTSYDIQSQGLQTQGQIVGLRQAETEINRARESFYNQYQLSRAQFMEDVRRTELDTKRLELSRQQFNAEANLNLIKMSADMAVQRAQIQYNYAAQDMDSSAVASDFNQFIGQLDKIIASNSAAM